MDRHVSHAEQSVTSDQIISISEQSLSFLKARVELISPVSDSLNLERPLVHFQEKVEIPFIQSPLAGIVSNKQFAPIDSVSSESEPPTMLLQERSTEQLISPDTATLISKQPLSTEMVRDEHLIPALPLDLQPSTLTKSSPAKQLTSSSQKTFVEPLELADDMAQTLEISPSRVPNESQKRQNWYQQSLILLKHQPIEIQQWCVDVYKAVETYSTEDDS